MNTPTKAPRFFFEFPLLKREFVSVLRTPRAFWLLVAVVVVSSIVPLISWTAMGSGNATPGSLAMVFTLYAVVQLFATVLIIPAFTAGAISGEREALTYDMLYSTLLSPSSIILSKVLSSVGYVTILLTASAPMAFSLYLLGGIGFDAILKCYLATFVAVVSSGVICLTASMRSARTAQAAVRGIASVILWNGGLSFACGAVIVILYQTFGTPGGMQNDPFFLFVALAMNPIYPMVAAINPGMIPFRIFSLDPWQAYLLYIGAVAALHAVYLFRSVQTPDLPQSTVRRNRRAKVKKQRASGQLTRFSRFVVWLGESGVPLLRNPVFLREARAEFFGRPWFRRAMFWGPLAAFACMLSFGNQLETRVGGATMVVVTFVVLLVPALVASAIPREREMGSFDLLRSSLLPMRDIVLGKYLAGLYSCWGVVAACGWAVLAANCVEHRSRAPLAPILLGSLGVPLVTLVFYAALAMFASAISRRTMGSLLITYGLVIALVVGLPVLRQILRGLDHDAFSYAVIYATNPYAASFALLDWGSSKHQPVFLYFNLFHLAGTAVLLWASVRLLEHRFSRDR